jgi:TPP-dependent pyruvate/acetoin dehydrogenase alpha subunit
MTVDACDVVAVYRVASESIAHARQGFGPTLIECRQWDGPDATRSPIMNMEKYLDRKGLFNKATKAEIVSWIRCGVGRRRRRGAGFLRPEYSLNPVTRGLVE